VRLEAAAGYRLPGVRGWGHFRGSKRPEVGPVQGIVLNNFYIGRLAGTEGVIWQYSACDVASSYTWAELHVSPKNPSAHWTSFLARRVAQELSERGWKLEAATTDNASEYRAQEFNHTLAQLGVKHIDRREFIFLAGSLSAVAIAAACSTGNSGNSTSGNQNATGNNVVPFYTTENDPGTLAFMATAIRTFQAAHTNIQVPVNLYSDGQ